MTLILSCLTEQYAIQVSDRRITDRCGNLIDDYENKATQYGALMAFAFSGRADIGGQPTYAWLTNALASTQSLAQALNQVATRATEEFKKIPPSAPFRSLTFVGVGWSSTSENSDLLPTFVTISNVLDNGKWAPAVKDRFNIDIFWLDHGFALVPPIGQAVPQDDLNQLRTNISRCIEHDTSPLEIIRLLGQAIRKVARSNRTVSQNLLAIVVPKPSLQRDDVLFVTSPYPRSTSLIDAPMFFDIPAETDQLTRIGPSFVTGNLVVEQVIFAPHSPDIEQYERQILSGKMPSELNEASLIAYANVSALVDEFADYLKTLGFGIMEGPSSGFETIQLLKAVGIKSLSDLDNVLKDSQSWGREYLRDTFVGSQTQPLANQEVEPTSYVERIRLVDLLLRKHYGRP